MSRSYKKQFHWMPHQKIEDVGNNPIDRSIALWLNKKRKSSLKFGPGKIDKHYCDDSGAHRAKRFAKREHHRKIRRVPQDQVPNVPNPLPWDW